MRLLLILLIMVGCSTRNKDPMDVNEHLIEDLETLTGQAWDEVILTQNGLGH
jgi:hypothetical protein